MTILTLRDVHTLSVIREVGSTSSISKLLEVVQPVLVDDFKVSDLTLDPSETDTLVGSFEGFILESDSEFEVKIGSTGATAYTTKSFKMRFSSATSVYVTNPSSENEVEVIVVGFTATPE